VALDQNINTLEKAKFLETDTNETAVRVSVSGGDLTGNFSVSGLKNGGLVTVVTINNTTWTQIPATPLTNRNAMAIINRSGQEIKINYSAVGGYVGVPINNNNERYYDIKDTIVLYAKSSSSSCDVIIEEIS